nr:hypothetical protein [Tanacetum cinerariifolium]
MASAPQIEYAPIAYNPSEFSSHETGLVVPIFQKGDDPIDAINHMMAFLTFVVASRYPATNNQLRTSSNPQQKITLLKNDFQKEESRKIDRESALEKEVKELNNIVFKRHQSTQTVHMLTKPQVFYNHATRQALGFQNPRYLKKAQQLKPNLYDGSVIGKSDVVVVPDSEDTLMHAEETKSKFQSKMETVLKENDRLLKHALGVDIVNIVVNNCMNVNCLTVDACEQCVTTESELKTDFIKRENYEMLLKHLEKHSLKEQVKGKAILFKAVSLNPIDPEILQVDVVPLVPKLRKNR